MEIIGVLPRYARQNDKAFTTAFLPQGGLGEGKELSIYLFQKGEGRNATETMLLLVPTIWFNMGNSTNRSGLSQRRQAQRRIMEIRMTYEIIFLSPMD